MTVFWCIILLTSSLFAQESQIELAHPHIDFHDQARIKNGAKLFAQHCLSCHSMHGLIYDPISIEAGITADTQPEWAADSWGGHPPPDLSLIAKRQSAEWIYTFLRSFYVDADRPTGYNNLVMTNTAMPNPFAVIGGDRSLIRQPTPQDKWFQVLELKEPGTLSPQEFHHLTADIVNYLVYAAEPTKASREALGAWVLGYFFLLWLVLMAVNRLYWKQIKQKPHVP